MQLKYLSVILVLSGSTLVLSCINFFPSNGVKNDDPECQVDPPDYETRQIDQKSYPNVPILNGVYCYNNGSGLCKAFAGRFEFYFNTFTDEILGPQGLEGKFVDSSGYHARVPVSYNTNGSIIYADRSINWANDWVTKRSKPINLLNREDFNWCAFTVSDYWPYTSSVVDAQTNGRFLMYFHNRQSCIFDKEKQKRQHFNTRFLHNSSTRLDLDYNPVIFAMEDHLANDIRLVKHKRQHWYEVAYRVTENPTPDISYFVEMATDEARPCKINDTLGTLFPRQAYAKFSDRCVNEYHARHRQHKNNALMVMNCGTEQTEIADITWVHHKTYIRDVMEVSLHNIPRSLSGETNRFYQIPNMSNEEWSIFALHGLVFSATTSIPIEGDDKAVRVISLYSNFKSTPAANAFDEYFPVPYIADYVARYKRGEWDFDRSASSVVSKNLNYVDDIAYLHQCGTILVIFGPLYTELPADSFNLETKAPVGSIYSLGLNEMTSAFFAQPETDSLFFYHRTNFVVEHKYTCGKDGQLVTAQRASNYYTRFGLNMHPLFAPSRVKHDLDYQEELFFQRLNIYQPAGPNPPEAPDALLFKDEYDNPAEPLPEEDNTWMYIIIGIAIILIIGMCLACLLTIRRRRKRTGKSVRSVLTSFFTSGAPSVRSEMSHGKPGHGSMSVRSSFKPGVMSGPGPSVRSQGGFSRSRSSSSKAKLSAFSKTKRSGRLPGLPSRVASTGSTGTKRSKHLSTGSSDDFRRTATNSTSRSALSSRVRPTRSTLSTKLSKQASNK